MDIGPSRKRVLSENDFDPLKGSIQPLDQKVITLDDRISFNRSQFEQMGEIALQDRGRPGASAYGFLGGDGTFDLQAIFQGTNEEFMLDWPNVIPEGAVALARAVWHSGRGYSHVEPSLLELLKAAPRGFPVVYVLVGPKGGFDVYKTSGYQAHQGRKEVTQRRWLFWEQTRVIAEEIPEQFDIDRTLYGPDGALIRRDVAKMIIDPSDYSASIYIGENPVGTTAYDLAEQRDVDLAQLATTRGAREQPSRGAGESEGAK